MLAMYLPFMMFGERAQSGIQLWQQMQFDALRQWQLFLLGGPLNFNITAL